MYIHPSDVRAHTFYLRFTCLDAPSTITDPKYATVIQGLTPGQWSYVLWEIPNLRRDKVTQFAIMKLLTGHAAEENVGATYDFDRLELQRVDTEKYEGWEVAPGKIAYNHVGYKQNQSKVALASGLSASLFQLRDARSGKVVLTKPIRSVKNNHGEFQILYFSEVREPGEYFLWAGDRTSRPFLISDKLWLNPIRKALNCYYSLRCGFDVPGVHPECHKDWQGIHNGKKKIITVWNGMEQITAGDASLRDVVTEFQEIANEERLYQHIHAALKDRMRSLFPGFDTKKERGKIMEDIARELADKGVTGHFTKSLFDKVVIDLKKESFYLNQLLPLIIEKKDAALREDFLHNSGLDRFYVEGIEKEYFEKKNLDVTVLDFLLVGGGERI